MSLSSSLLTGGVDAVGLNSAWSSLLTGHSHSEGCPVVVESETMSAFAAQDLRLWTGRQLGH